MQLSAKRIANRIGSKKRLGIVMAAAAGLAPFGVVQAAPLVTLDVEASSAQAGPYTGGLPSPPTAGSTLYFEVLAVAAPAGTTNGAKSTNGTSDSIVSLPNFTLVAAGASTITASTLLNNMASGSGASAGTTGGSSIDVRAIEQGFTVNVDTALPILSGTMTVGSGFTDNTVITATTDNPVTSAGSIKPSDGLVAVNNTSEFGGNPYIAYTPVRIVTIPEPASLGLLLLGAPALLARRRRRA